MTSLMLCLMSRQFIASSIALTGFGLNTRAGWWWAAPAAGLVIAALAVKEGLETWEHDG